MAKDKAETETPRTPRKVKPTDQTLVLCNRMDKILGDVPEPRRGWVLSFLQDKYLGPVNPMEQAS